MGSVGNRYRLVRQCDFDYKRYNATNAADRVPHPGAFDSFRSRTWRGFSKGINEGFVKVLAGKEDRILGIWICGTDASEQTSLFGPLLAGDLTIEGLWEDLILHPTLGEAALEAALELGQ